MDEYTAEAFIDQEESLPSVRITNNGEPILPKEEHYVTSSRSRLSASYLRDKINAGLSNKDTEGSKDSSSNDSLPLQDRLFTKLLQQVIPTEDAVDENEPKASTLPAKRPPFSLPTMTNNFRRFNARVGILFQFQNGVINLLGWKHRTQTWSFIFVYSFICLDPYLLVALPLVALLLFVMVPSFLARHPSPPPSASTSSTTPYYSYEGPALAPAKTIKPAPETSKDFFRNMRDLQNSMADFSVLHDTAVSSIAPWTNFSDEKLSSALFLLLTMVTASLFLLAHLLPWRLIFLFGGDALILSSHPKAESLMKASQQAMESQTGRDSRRKDSKFENSNDFVLFGLTVPSSPSQTVPFLLSTASISLNSYPEEHEVEIFELQHKTFSPYSASSEWEPFLFTPTPYDPLSPSRISGDRPKGTRFFEDVRSPPGWAWKSKKWELDLECREWVMERMVTGVEFEIPDSRDGGVGEEVGGWVWDLPFESQGEGEDDTANALSYGDSWESINPKDQQLQVAPGDPLYKGKGKAEIPEWEEATKRADRAGEWRRRRWVRVVQRITVDEKGS